MADIGVLVDLLRAEARVAREKREDLVAQRLLEMADDTGEMSPEQREWVEQASEEEVRGFAAALRLLGGG